MSRRKALQQAFAGCCKRSQNALGADAQGHHVGVVECDGKSDILGEKLRWGGKRILQFKAELVPHVIDRHRLSLPSPSTAGMALSFYNYSGL